MAGQTFTRCAQVSAPTERSFRAGALTLTVRDRSLQIDGPRELRIAAFTGPVGDALEPRDLLRLSRLAPSLAFYLGGLGDSEEIARRNLASLVGLRIPTLFIAGGADRRSVIEAAFASLPDEARDYALDASGLREVRVGTDRFVIVPGAPLGRYAVDAEGCGFLQEDLDALRDDVRDPRGALRTWLLSWHAPSAHGVSEGFGATDVGSPELRALAQDLAAQGGIYAYPETQAARVRLSPLALVVPRLGRVGMLRADGSRLHSGIASLTLTERGLLPTP